MYEKFQNSNKSIIIGYFMRFKIVNNIIETLNQIYIFKYTTYHTHIMLNNNFCAKM